MCRCKLGFPGTTHRQGWGGGLWGVQANCCLCCRDNRMTYAPAWKYEPGTMTLSQGNQSSMGRWGAVLCFRSEYDLHCWSEKQVPWFWLHDVIAAGRSDGVKQDSNLRTASVTGPRAEGFTRLNSLTGDPPSHRNKVVTAQSNGLSHLRPASTCACRKPGHLLLICWSPWLGLCGPLLCTSNNGFGPTGRHQRKVGTLGWLGEHRQHLSVAPAVR